METCSELEPPQLLTRTERKSVACDLDGMSRLMARSGEFNLLQASESSFILGFGGDTQRI